MENNGSPQPIIETDEQGVYFMVTLPINLKYVEAIDGKDSDKLSNQVNDLVINSLDDIIAYSDGVSNQVSNQVRDQIQDILNKQLHNRVEEILNIATKWVKRDILFADMNLSNHTKHWKNYFDPFLKIGLVEMDFPDKKTSPNQRYRNTKQGNNLLKLIK